MIRLFRHYVPASFLLLGLFDFVVLILSIFLAVELRFWGVNDNSRPDPDILFSQGVLFAVVMIASMTTLGMYWRNRRDEGAEGALLRIISSFFIGIGVISLIFYLFPNMEIGRGIFGISVLIAFVFVLFGRVLHYALADHEALKRRILVVGAGQKANQLETTMRRKSDRRGFNLVGYVHVRGQQDVVDERKIVEKDGSLREVAHEYEIDQIIIALDDRRKNYPVHEIMECKMSGIEVIELATFFERQTGKLKLEALHPSSLIFSDGIFSRAILDRASKRLIDLVVSLLLLGMLWPVMLITAIAIWVESGGKGPILYRQERVGRNGQVFPVLKFRSMRADAEKDGKARWATKNDERTTRVGRLIRQFRIDELPQLMNVLKGEMSFVGPRPERPEFVAELRQTIPFYDLRHKVKPGITGWAQVCYPYGSSDNDAAEKLQYDLYYLKNYSVFLDLMILFQTMHTVLSGSGAR